ncbi:hypothetical protein [Deinococcus roseus]|uniref:Immunity protein 30 domain-containing protein n=1 Tax=Deinococcus roseus TaxID=392414 RepID=A0ABQ2DEK2_9DEIO|nr:hypothetical protein [Deinococcus roseus]GGJ53130.1 hypothetical protein GCM10008938_43910 [Deinococcus roseus]
MDRPELIQILTQLNLYNDESQYPLLWETYEELCHHLDDLTPEDLELLLQPVLQTDTHPELNDRLLGFVEFHIDQPEMFAAVMDVLLHTRTRGFWFDLVLKHALQSEAFDHWIEHTLDHALLSSSEASLLSENLALSYSKHQSLLNLLQSRVQKITQEARSP